MTSLITTQLEGDNVTLSRADGGQLLVLPQAVGTIPSVVQTVAFLVGTATSQSNFSIPAGSLVLRTDVQVQSAYSPGAAIQVGQTGSVALLQASPDNAPGVPDTYTATEVVAWGASALPVLVTISGGPVAGLALIVVDFVPPTVLS